MFRQLAIAALMATSALANPFAAKQTPSDNNSAYMSKLLSNARRLDGGNDNAEIEADLTGYSLKFIKCQFVKAYDQDLADAGADSVLATQRFVVFRLCPSSKCGSCNYNYGEYAIDMSDYLDATVEYRQEEQEDMCETCKETCYYNNGDDGNAAADDAADAEEEEDGGDGRRRLSSSVDCDSCVSACKKIENMEANYYIDATTFINCQQIQEDNGYGALSWSNVCFQRFQDQDWSFH